MKITKETNAYCPKCNKHTVHKVKFYSKKPASGMSVGNRRHERKLKGYIGKVKGPVTPKKIGKMQKALLECSECKYNIEKVFGSRTRKKLEYKV
ncbi:MAG: 50S ribosomal protein L44e [Candidatus Marsarchaeota archaeon]|jgi:large subunit ribosomal protein L44e|nr:50S ribosomal protein L44e [Candidatus Marsarchaeota archaeon]